MHFETHAPAIEQPHPVAYRNAHGGTLAKPHCNAHHDTNGDADGITDSIAVSKSYNSANAVAVAVANASADTGSLARADTVGSSMRVSSGCDELF